MLFVTTITSAKTAMIIAGAHVTKDGEDVGIIVVVVHVAIRRKEVALRREDVGFIEVAVHVVMR